MNRPGIEPSANGLRDSVRSVLLDHWVSDGYTAPNTDVYPWMWLWDSCFHALVWSELGEVDRATTELRSALAAQDESGFVPHMSYVREPAASVAFWGRRGASSITQPPMYGHALCELERRGVAVPVELIRRAEAGIRFLLEQRHRHESGLVLLAHPWESGADDSPRWDSACPGGFSSDRWYEAKGEWVGTIERSPSGAPLFNPEFAVASVAFNALVAFNAVELARLSDSASLEEAGVELAAVLDERWDDALETWLDAGPTEGGSAGARTVEALLPSLVERDPARVRRIGELLLDDRSYGGDFGPAGVHRSERTFDPSRYWRGPSWPQLSYLLWLAQARADNVAVAAALADRLVRGAAESGLAEYWNPDDGSGLGAVPQAWAGVCLLVSGGQ